MTTILQRGPIALNYLDVPDGAASHWSITWIFAPLASIAIHAGALYALVF